MTSLILGPMLRHVTSTSATLWVETDAPCEVAVLDVRTRTFTVHGHHYALIVVEGLTPGSVTEYEVHLDGEQRWPLADEALPPSVIRTLGAGQQLRMLVGSCRAAAPHVAPWSDDPGHDDRARGADALRAHGLRMMREPMGTWPDLLLLVGDQVYADDPSPRTEHRMERAPRPAGAPDEVVGGFEQYTWLYHESWTPIIERWLFSVVPSAMIFDDHDMIDDWNISTSWVREIRTQAWWREHVEAGLVTYWIYQHLGNLSPDEVRKEGILAELLEVDDGTEILRAWARQSEADTPVRGGYRFSFHRDLGRTRVVVIDCRNGRVLEGGPRAMVDDDEWAWISELCCAPVEHLVIACSLPVFVPGAIHDLQVWNEAVCDGAWGARAARLGERLRRSIDLEDWPAFHRSFDAFVDLLARVGAPASDHPDPPTTITVVSGDIHFGYVAALEFPASHRVTSRVHQVVSSPIRNALGAMDRRAIHIALSRVGRAIGRGLRRSVRMPQPGVRWHLTDGPVFANEMAMLTIAGADVRLEIERARSSEGDGTVLEMLVDRRL